MFSSIFDTVAVILSFGQYLKSAFKVQVRALFGHISLLETRMWIGVFQPISFLGRFIPKLNNGRLAIVLKWVRTVRSEFPNLSGLTARAGRAERGWFCGRGRHVHLHSPVAWRRGQKFLRCSCEARIGHDTCKSGTVRAEVFLFKKYYLWYMSMWVNSTVNPHLNLCPYKSCDTLPWNTLNTEKVNWIAPWDKSLEWMII